MQCVATDSEYSKEALLVRGFSQDFVTPDKRIEAVRDLNLTVNRGRIVALVGESGSGKSATALTVMGIEDKNAEILGGEIYLAGQNIMELPPKKRRFFVSRHAGIVFQDPADSLNPLLTVEEQLIEAVRVHEKMSRKKAREKAVEQLRAVSLHEPEKLIKKYPFMLSGGMCQRVMIAVAMISKPPLLIADEPTTALDLTVQKQILTLLADVRKHEGTAILIITHDLGVVAEIADEVCIMKDGRVVEDGSVERIFNHPKHAYTKCLLEAAL